MKNKYIRNDFKIRKGEYVKRVIMFIIAMCVIAMELFKFISQLTKL